jgi:hypothetical protein
MMKLTRISIVALVLTLCCFYNLKAEDEQLDRVDSLIKIGYFFKADSLLRAYEDELISIDSSNISIRNPWDNSEEKEWDIDKYKKVSEKELFDFMWHRQLINQININTNSSDTTVFFTIDSFCRQSNLDLKNNGFYHHLSNHFIKKKWYSAAREMIDTLSCTNYYIYETQMGKNVYEPFFEQYFVSMGGLRFFRHEGKLELKAYITELVFDKIYLEIKLGNFAEAKKLNKILGALYSNAFTYQNNFLKNFNKGNEIKTLDNFFHYWSKVKVNQHYDTKGSERNFINMVKQLALKTFLTPEQSKFMLFLVKEEPQVKEQYEYKKMLLKATKAFRDNYGAESYYYGLCLELLAEHYTKIGDMENAQKAHELADPILNYKK